MMTTFAISAKRNWKDKFNDQEQLRFDSFAWFLSQILRAAPVLYFKKGRNMERARKIKKGDPTFCVSPLLLTSLSAGFIFFLRFSLAPSLKGSYVERLAKNKNTPTISGLSDQPFC